MLKLKLTGILCALIILGGCEQSDSINEIAAPEAKADQIHTVAGKVIAIHQAKGTITIDISHGVPVTYWPPSTMTFPVKDPGLLNVVKPGDHVTFTVDVSNDGQHVIQDIQRQ